MNTIRSVKQLQFLKCQMNSKCSIGALHIQLKHNKAIWSRRMRLPYIYILEPTGNCGFSFLSCIFQGFFCFLFFNPEQKGFFFSSFSFDTGFYPGVLKYSSSCSFSIKVNVEEGKCGSRHLTSFINEYLKLRNK